MNDLTSKENKMDIRAIIMAGGAGTRFWPLSRKKKPKQFLPIISDKTMIEETVNRLLPQLPPTNIYTIANFNLTQVIKALLPNFPEENFLVEPLAKNTAPSLMLVTARIYLQNPEAVLAVLPADHLIKDPALFLKKLEAGATAAAEREFLITFGIPPTYPATGYGYIQFSQENPSRFLDETFYAVQKFIEKPDYEKAKVLLEEGHNSWNSGMFLWQANVFAKKLRQYAPDMFSYWEKMLEALQNNDEAHIASYLKRFPLYPSTMPSWKKQKEC